jgi:hypothetical protein
MVRSRPTDISNQSLIESSDHFTGDATPSSCFPTLCLTTLFSCRRTRNWPGWVALYHGYIQLRPELFSRPGRPLPPAVTQHKGPRGLVHQAVLQILPDSRHCSISWRYTPIRAILVVTAHICQAYPMITTSHSTRSRLKSPARTDGSLLQTNPSTPRPRTLRPRKELKPPPRHAPRTSSRLRHVWSCPRTPRCRTHCG